MINYLRIMIGLAALRANWPAIILNKILSWPLDYIKLNGGVKFKIKDNKIGKADISMLSEIWFSEYYNPPFMAIQAGDVVFDIGANNGYFTIYAAIKAARGKVYAFEPVSDLYKVINDNLLVNKLSNVVVENIAVSRKNSRSIFYISKRHNGCHSIFRRNPEDKMIETDNVILEDYCVQHNIQNIDFLKLDCEGAEYEILLNSNLGFLFRIKKISMEYHDDITDHKHGELVDFLCNHNFMFACEKGYLYALNKNFL